MLLLTKLIPIEGMIAQQGYCGKRMPRVWGWCILLPALLLIPALCRAVVFVEQSFQYLLKLSAVLGRASCFVGIELLNVCTEMFPIGLFYKAENKTEPSPAWETYWGFFLEFLLTIEIKAILKGKEGFYFSLARPSLILVPFFHWFQGALGPNS